MNVQGIFRRCFPVLNRVFEQKHVPRLPQTFVLLMRVGRSWNIVFQVVFSEIPTYQDIINRTPKVYPIFVMSKTKKESTVMVDSNVFPKWQSTLYEFRTLNWREIKTHFETSGLLAFWRDKIWSREIIA